MEARKAMARASGLAGFQNSLSEHPTSISKVICKETEGRATQELEIIWWPNLSQTTSCGKFQMRFFIHNASFTKRDFGIVESVM